MKRVCLLLMLTAASFAGVFAQGADPAYVKSITERAQKIALTLNIDDVAKVEKVRDIIRDQYRNLNEIHSERDEHIKTLKKTAGEDKALMETAIKEAGVKTDAKLAQLHQQYLKKLSIYLSSVQIEQVKNGMTYNVVPLTYKAYQEQILTLTEAQKAQILVWLTEAREYAMDAESSEKKHAWFGKYKGRINNYLSAAGYDLKKEGQEWQKRIKAKAANDK